MYRTTQPYYVILVLCYLFVPHVLWGQTDSTATPVDSSQKKQEIIPTSFTVNIPDEGLIITSDWKDSATKFTRQILLASPTGGTFTFEKTDLQDAEANVVLESKALSISPSTLTLKKGEEKAVKVQFSEIPKGGRYTSKMFITTDKGKIKKEYNLELNLLDPTQITITEAEQGLNVKMARNAAINFNFMLPKNRHQEKFSLRVNNNSDYTAQVKDVTFSLIGSSTLHSVTHDDFDIDTDISIPPKDDISIIMALKKGVKISPDEYKGTLRVRLDGISQTYPINLNLKTKSSAAWALLLLVLGVIVGRVIRESNASEDQYILMNRLVELRVQINGLDIPGTQDQLKAELKALEKKINQVTNEASRLKVEESFPPFELKVGRIQKLYNIVSSSVDGMESQLRNEFLEQADKVESLIMSGKVENIEGEIGKLSTIVARKKKASTRSIGAGEEADDTITKELDKLTMEIKKPVGVEEEVKEKTFLDKIGAWFFKILLFFSGQKSSAMLKYSVFRPIAALTVFLLILLGGFNEIYIKGGDTFGMEGLYDYLKLFLWGIISDVFSNKLTDNPFVATLAPNRPQKPE